MKKYDYIVGDNEIYDSYGHNDLDVIQVPFSLFENEECIELSEMEKKIFWDESLTLGKEFYFSDITDDSISECLEMDLSDVDVSKDWGNFLDPLNWQLELDKHSMRVAKLVKEFLNKKSVYPVSLFFDVNYFRNNTPNFIADGNHRIRAFQYLGYTHFPAFVYGSHGESLIKKIKEEE